VVDPVARVPLGRAGLHVTRVGLGTAPLGGLLAPVPEDRALATVQRSYDCGLRFFDTAPYYGYGLSEIRLGRALRRYPRDHFVLSTKVGRLLRLDAPPDPHARFKGALPLRPVFDFSYEAALRSLEESLGRLGLEHVDIAYIHDPDDHFDEALAGAYRALDTLRRQGVISGVGVGMNHVEMLIRFAEQADFDCFLVAGRYTLLDQSASARLLPLCQARGIDVVAGGVYNSGILANPSTGATFNYEPAGPEVLFRARRIADICGKWGVPLKAAALQFPFSHPAVKAILIGCRSPDEVDENLAMLKWKIPSGLWRHLMDEGLIVSVPNL
jgi:D-threo-aldose 1-dehydrogenase